MSNLIIENLDIVLYTCVFLVPGFIVNTVIDTMVPPSRHNEQKYFIKCLSYSILTLGVFSGFFQLVDNHIEKDTFVYWALLSLIACLGSFALAVVIGWLKQKKIFDGIFKKSGLNRITSIPTAWDFYFSQLKSAYVIVTLDDDSIIYGLYSSNSFSSSDFEDRDLFLEKIYTLNKKQQWILNEECSGILIEKNKIKTIEIYNTEG